MSPLDSLGLMLMGFVTTSLLVFGLLVIILAVRRLRQRWGA